MKPAKIRTLSVRPIRSADLAFSSPGVLGRQGTAANLGASVVAGSRILADVHQKLDVRSFGPKAPGRVVASAGWINEQLMANSLFILRNERAGAELDQSIAMHHAEYLEKFADSAAIGPILRAENKERVKDFQELHTLFAKRHQDLAASYANSHGSVVSSVSSTSRHDQDSPAVVKTYSSLTQFHTAAYKIKITDGGIPAPGMTHAVDEVLVSPRTYKAGQFQPVGEELAVNFAAGQPKVSGVLTQVSETTQQPVVTVTEMHEHSHPSIDENIGAVSALGEIDASRQDRSIRGLRLQHYEDVLDNEDRVLLMDVRKRQISYIETYLLPPFSGRITAVFKDVGEYVQPGEPVLRLECDDTLLLVGFVQYKGLIRVDDSVTLKVRNIFESGDELAMMGRIVSVRGHEADDDEWDIIIEIANENGQQVTRKDGSLDTIRLPLNLQFDRFETDLSIGRAA
jgi:hypothetical protein